MIPYLSADDVNSLLPPADAVAAIENALADGLDPATGVARTSVALAHGEMLLMPAESAAHVGVKLATVAPGNSGKGLPRIHAVYVLFDAVTLVPTAIIDGTALTTLRTPAVSYAAVRRYVPAEPNIVIFGAGPQGREHRRMAEALFHPRTLTCVTSKSDVNPADLQAADLVVCATTARTPLFDSALLGDRAVVVAVGSHEPDAREVDSAFCARATVIVEDRATALRECGDVVRAVAEGALDPANLKTMSEVDDVTTPVFFKGSGMAWQDLVIAEAILQRRNPVPGNGL